jgi:hypothetical protein
MGPQPLQVQIHLGSMNTEDRDGSTSGDDSFAERERCRYTNRLNGSVHAATVGQIHDTFCHITSTVDGVGRAEFPRNSQAVLVQVD